MAQQGGAEGLGSAERFRLMATIGECWVCDGMAKDISKHDEDCKKFACYQCQDFAVSGTVAHIFAPASPVRLGLEARMDTLKKAQNFPPKSKVLINSICV